MTTAVVVGSGPNGLAAALTLAAAGVRVKVIEAADTLGGGIRSTELTAPGLVHDECAGFHPLATNSAFVKEFDLEGAGVKWLWSPYEFAHPLTGGRGAALQRSVAGTANDLGTDGDSWQRTFGPLTKRFDQISQEFLQPMLHIPSHPLPLTRFGAYAAMPATLLARRWHTDETKALFAGVAAHSFTRLDRPFSSAAGIALGTAAHAYGWPVAQGGSAAIADAIIARTHEYDVRFETGRLVTTIGELAGADIVMLDTAPRAAANILKGRQPERFARAYRRYRHGPAAFKVDFAIEGEVPWQFEPARRAGTVHLGGTLEQIAAAEAATNAGKLAAQPFVLVGQQFVADPSRSHGSLNPLYAYAHVPHTYDGPDETVTELIISQIEKHAPGFRDRIHSMHVRSAREMERHNPNYVGGDIATGIADMRQLVFRPRIGLNPYYTGVPGTYLCSAATPPGAGAHGMSGYLAAKSALAKLR